MHPITPHRNAHKKVRDKSMTGRTSRGSSFFGDFFGALLGVMGRERLPGAGASLDGIGMRQSARPCTSAAKGRGVGERSRQRIT